MVKSIFVEFLESALTQTFINRVLGAGIKLVRLHPAKAFR